MSSVSLIKNNGDPDSIFLRIKNIHLKEFVNGKAL